MTPTTKHKNKHKKKVAAAPAFFPVPEPSWWDSIKTVVYALLLALLVRTAAYEPFSIPSASMVPTLLVHDYLFVSKLSYGYSRYSLPLGLPVIRDRIFSTPPERGDVVVFKLPMDNKTDFIKRVIGLPGEKIQVMGGVVFINGTPVQRRLIEDYEYEEGGRRHRARRYVETLPNGRQYQVLDAVDGGPLDDTDVYTLPERHYFMMGDNRDNSVDSRVLARVGYVPFENLVGRATVIFFSNDAPFWQVWKWPFSLRYSRFFDRISPDAQTTP